MYLNHVKDDEDDCVIADLSKLWRADSTIAQEAHPKEHDSAKIGPLALYVQGYSSESEEAAHLITDPNIGDLGSKQELNRNRKMPGKDLIPHLLT